MSAPAAAALAGPGGDGLQTDQAPRLAIPAAFYLIAPLALVASGAVLAWGGAGVIVTRWLPLAMAATHLGTLGLLGAVMLGSLYQMIPVVAGAPVPVARLAHAVQLLFVGGLGVLVAGLATGLPELLAVAPHLLGTALVLFLGPVAVALWRAPTRSPTVWGMRLAVGGLAAVAGLGVAMALGRAGRLEVTGDWLGWVSGHAALGGAVWVGGLLTAVSWQVVPMFYLAPPPPRWSQRATLGAVALALGAVPTVVLGGGGPEVVALVSAPAAVMIWGVHPWVTIGAIRRRRRPRVDGSVRFWVAGLAVAPLVPLLAAGAVLSDDPRWAVGLGWVTVWGWGGLIAHGMLTRIVPFLVWFHRYSAKVGLEPVPSMRQLWPDRRVRLGLGLHLAALAAGAAAIASGAGWLAQAAGVLLAATGLVLLAGLIGALAPRRTTTPAR